MGTWTSDTIPMPCRYFFHGSKIKKQGARDCVNNDVLFFSYFKSFMTKFPII